MAIDNKKIGRIESDINQSMPYLASDEKSSTLKDPYPSTETRGQPTPDDDIEGIKQQLYRRKGQILLQQQLQKEKEAEQVKPWVHFVSGGLGGMCGAIFTSPFDVVKTRLQSSVFHEVYKTQVGSRSLVSSIGKHFQETCSIIYNVYKIEGSRALFKGLGPNLIGVIPARSINFFTYDYTKGLLKKTDYFKGEETSFIHLLAGLNAGIVTSTATNPIWLIKTRLQLDKATKKEYKNSIDCLRKTIKNEGFFALYKGLSASYLGSAESTIQWILYEQMKGMIRHRAERLAALGRERTRVDNVADWFARSGAAGFAKLIASLITYPHEVVRTRLRQAPMENGKPKYTGLIQCFKLVFKEEGFVSMYGGLTPHLMRTVPNSMIMFGSWELFTKALSKL
ncbi:hypothetical protein FOA43_003161 [Brettanomyces nanus]|uniref:Mitochondrial carrier protein n=1 Tax=Eeniella nana TaxID=13502 RepID=A0A875S7W8_EENNA|nr:uncharacterized protein FOA43_003161 [Brettanomyces nanus]QPG75799.1 hypothetical protein FOA43_003161 [Brettanomyces nanus]